MRRYSGMFKKYTMIKHCFIDKAGYDKIFIEDVKIIMYF